MKELEIAVKQLRNAMKNVDKAEENLFRLSDEGKYEKLDELERIALEIATTIDDINKIINKIA